MANAKYPAPTSVKEAASQLDSYKPEWYKNVDINKLNMNEGYSCIIGQGINNCKTGLYGLTMTNIYGRNYNGAFFQSNEYKSEWIEEILLRRKKGEGMTFVEAIQALIEGKKVRSTTWGKDRHWIVEGDCLKWAGGQSGAMHTNSAIFMFTNDKFELYNDKTFFSDLKAGDKFTSKNGPVWIKAEDVPYAVGASNPLAVCRFELTDEVKKVS
jgi:hypothetical protein